MVTRGICFYSAITLIGRKQWAFWNIIYIHPHTCAFDCILSRQLQVRVVYYGLFNAAIIPSKSRGAWKNISSWLLSLFSKKKLSHLAMADIWRRKDVVLCHLCIKSLQWPSKGLTLLSCKGGSHTERMPRLHSKSMNPQTAIRKRSKCQSFCHPPDQIMVKCCHHSTHSQQ